MKIDPIFLLVFKVTIITLKGSLPATAMCNVALELVDFEGGIISMDEIPKGPDFIKLKKLKVFSSSKVILKVDVSRSQILKLFSPPSLVVIRVLFQYPN